MNTCTKTAVAALACLLLVPAVRGAEHEEDTLSTPAAIQRDARQIGENLRRQSDEIARQVVRGAHEFQKNVKHWWDRLGTDPAGETARERFHTA